MGETTSHIIDSAFVWSAQHNITHLLDLLGTLAFAISGVRLASGKDIDLLGAFFLGAFTAVGGGTLRDLLLGVTPFWMQDPSPLLISIVALIIVALFYNLLPKVQESVAFFDAIGLGLFTVVGIEKTLALGFPFWVAMIMGVITGSFGGMIRDICLNEVPLIFRKDIYALACLMGGVCYWIMISSGVDQRFTALIAALVVVAIRLIALRYPLSLPTLKG